MPSAAGLTPLSLQTSGNTTCPTSTPASRSSACCFCCVSRGMFPRGDLALAAHPVSGVGPQRCPAESRVCFPQIVPGRVRKGHGAGLSPQSLSRTLLGVRGWVGCWDTPCLASPPTAVCTPFGLSTMFTVTGKLLVKPRVRCSPWSCCPSLGACCPWGCLVSRPGHGVHIPPPAPHGFLTHLQLLEDLEEQLSCTRLEEAAMSRRISSGGCPARATGWEWGGQGRSRAPLPHNVGALSPHEPLGIFSLAGKASCWLNLNMELLREQFFAIRSKRRKLGNKPGWGASPGHPGSLQLGTGSLCRMEGGWV